eukprot:gene20340-27102_t
MMLPASANYVLSLVVTVLLLPCCPALASEHERGLKEELELKVGTFKFADIDVNYQMYDHPSPDVPVVLFLHGMKFSSENWVQLGTLKMLRENGFKPMAVDLPGYGKTRRLPYSDNNMRAEFVRSAFEAMGVANLTGNGGMLVTPSMSGKYAIPYLDRFGRELKGWLAIAPLGVKNWGGPWEDTHRRVKLMAMYGEQDPMVEDASILTKLFSTSQKKIVPGAGHACYMDKPDIFHDMIKGFAQECFKKQHRSEL